MSTERKQSDLHVAVARRTGPDRAKYNNASAHVRFLCQHNSGWSRMGPQRANQCAKQQVVGLLLHNAIFMCIYCESMCDMAVSMFMHDFELHLLYKKQEQANLGKKDIHAYKHQLL